MASASFRDSLNSLGWNRRDSDVPARTNSTTPILSKIQAFNPFAGDNSIRLPTDEAPGAPLPARTRQEEDEAWFALSRWDRILIFGALNLAALTLFIVCIVLFPILSTMRPRKFAVLWSMASMLFLASWAVMMGPKTYVRHLLSTPRLPFTATYFGSIAATLFFAIQLQSTILTMISSIVQLACLLWYTVSYFPMGSTGLRFAASFGTSRVAAWMGG